MTLAEAPKGRKVRVTGGWGGWGFRDHLQAMGIHVGEELVVVQNGPFHGPVLVEVVRSGVKVALGYGMAKKLEVVPVDEDSPGEA